MDNIILMTIIVGCIIFIGVCLIKKRPAMLIDFLLRAFIGTAGIYLLDLVLRSYGYGFDVGINSISVLTNGLLGLPGFLLLYGLAIYYSY